MNDETIVSNLWNADMLQEVFLHEPDNFLKIKETLTRIGISSGNRLFQSCYILHKRGKYFIVHFKELFLLDGKPSSLSIGDLKRRNQIAMLLCDWGLLEMGSTNWNNDIMDIRISENNLSKNLKIVSFKDKHNWELKTKYTIGKCAL